MRHQRWSRFVVPILFYFGARFVFEQTERPTISSTANQPVAQQEKPLTAQPVKRAIVKSGVWKRIKQRPVVEMMGLFCESSIHL